MLSGFQATFNQILELARGEECDELGILRPTAFTLEKTFKILLRAIQVWHEAAWPDLFTSFPRGAVTTDENGGLRIEWLKDDRAVCLVVAAAEDERSYLYHAFGNKYGTGNVTGRVLAKWLQRFQPENNRCLDVL